MFQLCVWDAVGWKKLCSKFLHSFQTGLVPETTVVNHIQFHPDQIHLLSIHEGQIDVYEAPTLNHISQVLLISNIMFVQIVVKFHSFKFFYVTVGA